MSEDRKKKRQQRKAARKAKKGSNGSDSSMPVFAQTSGTTGSCESGNLKAKKSTICKTKAFNANKKKLKGRTVGSAKKRKRAELKAATGKTAAGRAIANIASKFKRHNTDYGNPRFL